MICRHLFTTVGIIFLFLICCIHGSILNSLKPSDYPMLMDDQLETKWTSNNLKKVVNIPGVCRQLELHIIETSLSGRMTEIECGLAGYKRFYYLLEFKPSKCFVSYDKCQLNFEKELIISLDIRQCRFLPFR